MNHGIYRLVFSKVLNMVVPVSEVAKSRNSKTRGQRVRRALKNVLLMILVVSAPYTFAAGPAGLDLTSATNAAIAAATANSMTIQQTAPKAVLDWNKLNLNAGELLKFDQQGNRGWSALNRIHDLAPSMINGSVQADGNVYFINTNGIIFGPNSQVNVGSLYASSLDVSDTLFNNGILSGGQNPVFTGTGGFVEVQEGAKLYAASGGRVVLLAPTITNHGLINTPDGQTILAAGKKVYLQALSAEQAKNLGDLDQRNFLVEVDSGGTATNLGNIVADRGNVTIAGLLIKQQGVISASTSVRANGSIMLLARDTVHPDATGLNASNGGQVILGKDSVTEVRVETSDTEEITKGQAENQDNPFKKSSVFISGGVVDVEGKIVAKGGNVTIANTNDYVGSQNSGNLLSSATQRVYLGESSLIDVSGIDAVAPMDRNQLEIQLYSDQLKDVPLLRGSDLYKQIIYVDARKITANGKVGTDLTDVTPYLNLKGRTVAELMSPAGTVSLAYNAIQRAGSVVDVSGGTLSYLPGSIKETQVSVNGKSYAISEINPNTAVPVLADTFSIKDSKWGVTRYWNLNGNTTEGWGGTYNSNNVPKATVQSSTVAGYKIGTDAGEIRNIDGANNKDAPAFLVQEGTLLANTYVGDTQRGNTLPLGGKVTLAGDFMAVGDLLPSDFTVDTEFSIKKDEFRKSNLNFLQNGFNRVRLVGKLDSAANVSANGTVELNAEVKANVIAPGSNITILNKVADNVTISSAGLYTNDSAGIVGAMSQPVATNAGSITIGQANSKVAIGDSVTLDASAGAWQGQNGILHKGKAGNIEVNATGLGQNDTFKSYGFDKGGSLTVLTSQGIGIATSPKAGDWTLAANFFQQGGFSSYNLTSDGASIVMGDGSATDIYSDIQTFRLNQDYIGQSSGAMTTVASTWLAPEYQRKASSVTIAATNSNSELIMNENTHFHTDVGGGLSLKAGKRLTVLGDMTAKAGNISLAVTGSPSEVVFDPSNGLFVGEHANLNAAGVYRALPNANGLLSSEVFNGGNISLATSMGPVVLKEGALLDVSAAAGEKDVQLTTGYQRQTIYGDAGGVSIKARDGFMLDSDFKANATGYGRGGSFNLALQGNLVDGKTYPTAPDILVTQSKTILAQHVTAGGTLLSPASTDAEILALKDKAQISIDQIKQGGFDNLSITNGFGSQIAFEAGSNLVLPGQLSLNSPLLSVSGNGNVGITADYIKLQSSGGTAQAANSSINLNAKQIVVQGATFNNVNHTTLNASQDIVGAGIAANLVAPGEIDLIARNIYPATGSTFSVQAQGADSKIVVNNSGAAAKPVLSAQGTLNLTADNIEQNGTLRAPFGIINLNAKKALTLGEQSLTSVSTDGQLIPYSVTKNSGLGYETGLYQGSDSIDNPTLKGKAINLVSDKIVQKTGSKIDLSGGGDMYAYEWIPGIGGSKDVLAQPNYFAVLPSVGTDYAPIDTVYQNSSSNVKIGDTVYLAGVDGLASGTYTLLPARYALMPGAYLIKAGVSTGLLPRQTAKLIDGTANTTGYIASAATGAHDANWSSFNVMSGDVLRPAEGMVSHSPSEYKITNVSTYFADLTADDGIARRLPQDAGQLSLNATSLLDLNGTIAANHEATSRGALVDIASADIRVVAEKDAQTGALQLKATDLNHLNVESILLGGTRSNDGGVSTVITAANTVIVENNASNPLQAPEILLAAKDTVTVKSNATIKTNTTASNQASKLKTSGQGALLAVSGVNDITYTRDMSGTPTQGTLNIETGANIQAGRSLVVDSTKDSTLKGTVTVADGGSATFGANTILLGNPSASVAGLNISNATLAGLGKLGKFTLNSNNNVDVYGSVDFGNQDLDLTIHSAGLVGHLSAGDSVNLTARNLEIGNSAGTNYVSPASTNGSLNITAANTVLTGKTTETATNAGVTKVGGFADVNLNTNELRTVGTGSTTFDTAQTKLNAGRITADTGSDFKVASTGNLHTAKLTTPIANTTASSRKEGAGAKLAIEANQLTVANAIDLASGNLTLTSKTGDLVIDNGATINAKSAEKTFYDKTVATQAGKVNLVSESGNVSVNAGAVVDVSSTLGADAGMVGISATTAGKTANIAGDLKGGAGADVSGNVGNGANLSVDIDKLANIVTTNKQAAGFTGSRQYRVRHDDVAITGVGADALKSKEVIVAADNGAINVSGEIDASSAKNGHIGLFAKNNVTLESTAKLSANSTQAGASGGKVDIGTTSGSLDFKSGSTINVAGGAGGEGGQVHFRTPRTGVDSGNGVAVTNFAADIQGAKSTVLEGYKVITTLDIDSVNADVSGFMANKDSIVASLNKTGDNTFHLRAGEEIDSNGDLSIDSDWNLYSDGRAGNEPAVLTLRAKGNLNINGTLSDGFATAELSDGQALDTDSWTYNLVAGAEMSSANMLTTTKSANTGDVNLAAGKGIRTGTGDINIATGGNLVMGDTSAVIYTAGRLDNKDLSAWFTTPTRGNPVYMIDGGSVNIRSQGNIVGAEPLTGRQLINNWLFRVGGGSSKFDTSWWARPDLFKQSVATFGGGNVNVQAGQDISNFSASVATSGRFDSNGTSGNSTINGGGDLTVNAGGNIENGVYFVAKGIGNIHAAGSIQKTDGTFGTTLALQDGQLNVSAGKNVYIEGIINPTLAKQSTANTVGTRANDLTGVKTKFNTYGDTSALNVVSTAGDITFGDISAQLTNKVTGFDTTANTDIRYFPVSLSLATTGGNIQVESANLMPGANGNLNMLAANDIKVHQVTMSDADPSSIAGAFSPVSLSTTLNTAAHDKSLLHADDMTSAMIVANAGSITGNDSDPVASIVIPKAIKVVAGQDIKGLNAVIQHNHSSDVTLIKAGHDLKSNLIGSNVADPTITLSGPGELLIETGRNIDLGGGTVRTIANADDVDAGVRGNSALPKAGASITLEAGLGEKGATVDSYISQYILPNGSGPASIQGDAQALADYHLNTTNMLTAYVRKVKNDSSLTDAQALSAFNTLSAESKAIFVYRHLSSELLASGETFSKTQNNNRGYQAIATLFPHTNNAGNLVMYNAKVSTLRDGSIDIVVPHGAVNAGLAGGGGKSDTGIITQHGGAIRALADRGFEVNTSKVITQYGSDITVWVSHGDIDAGRGSKTATSIPQRIVSTDVDGNTTIDNVGVATGSGIRAQTYDPDGPNGPQTAPAKGKVALIAPDGKLDAGEAGIEAGDFLAVATQVLGADNISVSGVSQGVPAAAASGVTGASAGLSPDATSSAVQDVAKSVAENASNQTMTKPNLPSIISVDVIGYGE